LLNIEAVSRRVFQRLPGGNLLTLREYLYEKHMESRHVAVTAAETGSEPEVPMPYRDRIAVDPEILAGKPVIKGTRLAVEFIIELLAEGWSHEDILKNYPGLVADDILACLGYAGAILRSERVYPLEPVL
jgi:uncharacterized protein (DUF433 family)